MIDIQAIRAANHLPSIVAAQVRLQRSGNEWKGCCPFHADSSPSFTIFAHGQRFHCFGCGASGDVLDFVQRAYGVPLPEAARMLGAADMSKLNSASCWQISDVQGRRNSVKTALAIWERAEPITGTLAEVYLQARGLQPPYPPSLRFLSLACDKMGLLPCLVASVQDAGGDVIGIQRIWLAHDGKRKADVAKPKRSLGHIKGGAIRLGEPGEPGLLTVCEGPEDGLSLLEMLGRPVWVAAGATFLPAMQFPPEVRSILIGADNDPAGREAADKAALAFTDRGLTVRIFRPLEGFKDFNDELRGNRT